MQECWRWFGPQDPVSLCDIRQAGATGIVTALHDQPNGAVWPEAAIAERIAMIRAAGLDWRVVESIPVHEDIKTASPGWEEYAQNWAETARRLARQGVRTICYNFMPVLDWTRTDLEYEMPDGALALRFDDAAYVAFDLFILKRHTEQYTTAERAAAEDWMAKASPDAQAKLVDTILAGLPGSEESYSVETFAAQLAKYDHIDADQLRQNLSAFLAIVLPVAEAAGFTLAIHPDDPPFSLFGLPKITSTLADLQAIQTMQPSPANGFTFCTGSLGARSDNDMADIIDATGDRIYFAHLRSTRRAGHGRSFHEAAHLDGDVDMVAVVSRLLALEEGRDQALPMRPDHGHKMLSDLRQQSTPGYPAIGRLRGLAELRGVMRALSAMKA